MVRTAWLEDCDRQKKEIPVLGRHMAYDELIPKGLIYMAHILRYLFFWNVNLNLPSFRMLHIPSGCTTRICLEIPSLFVLF